MIPHLRVAHGFAVAAKVIVVAAVVKLALLLLLVPLWRYLFRRPIHTPLRRGLQRDRRR
jgi:hypothetical protein